MEKILISNIGNRNLKLDGKFISKIFDADENISFREQTLLIWEQIKRNSFQGVLEPVILNEVIEKEREELKKVILFSSDMPETMRNDQDTIFEGEILCTILKQSYPEIEFTNVPFNASVFVHDELFRKYHRFLSGLKKENQDVKIIYCDAGGTSQQKFAAKISLEYLFDPNQFIVYYVAQEQKGQSTVMRGESYEYRKIIDMEHVLQAINSSAYQLALNKIQNLNFSTRKFPYSLILFLDLRSRLFIEDAKRLGKEISQSKTVPVFVLNYQREIPIGMHNNWQKILNKKQFFQLCEILVISQWKYSIGLVEQALHLFSMFMENYISFVIRFRFGYKFDEFFESAFRKLKEDIEKGVFLLPEDISTERPSVPFLLAVAEQIDNTNHLELIGVFKQLNSLTTTEKMGIDTFRNKYAHKGKGVRKEEFENTTLYGNMVKCYGLFGIDFNRNYYGEMHNEVCEIIRKS